MSNTLILPVLVPLLVGALLVLTRPRPRIKRFLAGGTVTALMGIVLFLGWRVSREGVLLLRFGNWEPPFGIVFAVDWLSILMYFFLNLIGFCVIFYSFYKRERGADESAYFYALMMFQLAGVNGALSTGDLFNLFVWYEVMLISSYALLGQGGYRDKMKGVPDYIIINMLSSALFLVAIALTYISYGTLNMAHIGQLVNQGFAPSWSTALAVLFFVVFGTKAAVFPFYFWLFRGYPLASTPVAALFGGLLTKVGVYSMLRVFPLMFPAEFLGEASFIRVLFYVVGCASILFGVFGALSRHEWKDVLSHHITSQIGYMIVGIGLWSQAAIAGTLYYIVQHTVVKSGLFLIGGMTEDYTGTTDLEEQTGLIYNLPVVGGLFLTAGLALAGLPPLSGFFAKMTIFYAAFEQAGAWPYTVVAVGLVGGLFTLYSMVKIWRLSFLGEPTDEWTGSIRRGLFVGPVILVITSIVLGLAGGSVMVVTNKASYQIKNTDEYIHTVLEKSPVYRKTPEEYEPHYKGGEGKGHH